MKNKLIWSEVKDGWFEVRYERPNEKTLTRVNTLDGKEYDIIEVRS